MSVQKNRLLTNSLLLLSAAITSLSGVVMQVGYHISDSSKVDRTILGLGYADWSVIHKIAIVVFALLCLYHICLHWKWYKVVLKKPSLRSKNRQVILFSELFILSALTGLIPWMIDLFGTTKSSRIIFIEIHDKISLILVVFIVLHVIGRTKSLFKNI